MKSRMAELDEETIRRLYVDAGWSAKRIAEKYGLRITQVFCLIHQYGYARRNQREEWCEGMSQRRRRKM